MTPNCGLGIIDALLAAVLVLRLVALKRAINRYRPPSPLPPGHQMLTWEGLTIRRVS